MSSFQITYVGADTCPILSTALTGTVSAGAGSRFIVGSGTLFLSEISNENLGQSSKQLGCLVNLSDYEIREIESIHSDTNLTLKRGFTAAQSGDTVRWCPTTKAARIQIIGASAKVNNVAVPTLTVLENGAQGNGTGVQAIVEACTALIST